MAALDFVPASGQDVFSIETTNRSRSKTTGFVSGEEVRNFYEDLVKEGKSSGDKRDDGRKHQNQQKSRRERRRERAAGELRREIRGEGDQRGDSGRSAGSSGGSGRSSGSSGGSGRSAGSSGGSERSSELLGLRFLRCANEGDVSGLKDLLSKGVDINFQDTYLWTAMMCASWSGQRAAVRLLLQRGAAWVGVVDTRGRDARDLALEASHQEVLEELESYGRSPQRGTRSDSTAAQPQWCGVCRSEYSSSLSSHLSSTLHQFSLRRPPPTPYYCLPPSSNSYKMMVRCGWKPGTGLGPEGEGPKQPVPTVLKRDQKGLGYGQMKRAKVTHFQARDHEAVKAPPRVKEERGVKGLRKDKIKRKEQKDKNWERDFRTSFYL